MVYFPKIYLVENIVQSVASKVFARIRKQDKGWVFSARDFVVEFNSKNLDQAQCSIGLRATKGLGGFNTAEEAFQAYKIFKESLIKEVAKKYKDVLDVRVYQKLIKYEITITD